MNKNSNEKNTPRPNGYASTCDVGGLNYAEIRDRLADEMGWDCRPGTCRNYFLSAMRSLAVELGEEYGGRAFSADEINKIAVNPAFQIAVRDWIVTASLPG